MGGSVRRLLPVIFVVMVAGCLTDETGKERQPNTRQICDREGIPACQRGGTCSNASLACSDGCCLPRCASNGDCAAGSCGGASCFCDDSICQQVVCSADADCDGGQACSGGECVAMPGAEQVASCRVEPSRWVTREGVAAASLTLQAYDRAGVPLPGIGRAAAKWESSDPSRGSFDAAGDLRGGSDGGAFVVTATVGAASCTASFSNFGAPPAGSLRVVAIDELSGMPIADAPVQVESAAPVRARTGANGVAILQLSQLPAAPRTISVLPADHTWLTLVGTSETDVLVPLRRGLSPERAGGFVGSFDPASFDPALLNAGLVGMSIPGSLVDLSFTVLLGPVARYDVELGGSRKVNLPQGLVLGLGNTWFKPGYQALGLPGSCADDAKTRDGACGTWTAWGLAGGMPLEELPIDELAEGGDSLDVGRMLAHLLPHVRRFHSAVVRDVEFDRVATKMDGGKAVPDTSRFTNLDLRPTTRMGLRATVEVPDLPVASGRVLDGVVVLGGSLVPGRGLVPLGFTAGVDAGIAGGGVPTRKVREAGGAEGSLALRLSPAHGGTEGSPYAVVAMAVNFTGLMDEDSRCTSADRAGCASLSALVSVRDRFDSGGKIAFPAGAFPTPADGSTWDSSSRIFHLDGAATDLMRLSLGSGDRKWTLYFQGGPGEFTVPIPVGLEDRAAGARASVQSMRTDAGWAEVQGFGPRGLADLARWTTAFSTADLPE